MHTSLQGITDQVDFCWPNFPLPLYPGQWSVNAGFRHFELRHYKRHGIPKKGCAQDWPYNQYTMAVSSALREPRALDEITYVSTKMHASFQHLLVYTRNRLTRNHWILGLTGRPTNRPGGRLTRPSAWVHVFGGREAGNLRRKPQIIAADQSVRIVFQPDNEGVAAALGCRKRLQLITPHIIREGVQRVTSYAYVCMLTRFG